MGFWDRVKKDLHLVMKEGADLFKEGTTTLSAEARRMAKKGTASVKAEAHRMSRIANLRLQLFRLNQKAQAQLSEIGGCVYDMAGKNPEGFQLNGKLKKSILEAKKVEIQISRLNQDIKRLSKGSKK